MMHYEPFSQEETEEHKSKMLGFSSLVFIMSVSVFVNFLPYFGLEGNIPLAVFSFLYFFNTVMAVILFGYSIAVFVEYGS